MRLCALCCMAWLLLGCGSDAGDGSTAGTGGAGASGATRSVSGVMSGGAPASGISTAASSSGGENTGTGAATSGAQGGSGGQSTGGVPATSNGGSGGMATASGSGGTSGVGGMGASGGSGGVMASPYKGLAFYEEGRPRDECADLEALDVSWFYNWSGSSSCEGQLDAEFVPQIWGSWRELSWVPQPAEIVQDGRTAVLGFNEPDHSDQSNLTVEQALSLWQELDLPGVRVGSPATASDGQAWFEAFMQGVAERGLRIDFIAIH